MISLSPLSAGFYIPRASNEAKATELTHEEAGYTLASSQVNALTVTGESVVRLSRVFVARLAHMTRKQTDDSEMVA